MGWRGDTIADRRTRDGEADVFRAIRRVLLEERADLRRALDEDGTAGGELDVNRIVTYILRPVWPDVLGIETGGERVIYYFPDRTTEGFVSAKPASVNLQGACKGEILAHGGSVEGMELDVDFAWVHPDYRNRIELV